MFRARRRSSVCCRRLKKLSANGANNGSGPLLDHLVGTGKQRRWNDEAESFRRIEVDDQFELGGQQDRQVYRLDPGDNATRIGTRLTVGTKDTRTIANKTTGL